MHTFLMILGVMASLYGVLTLAIGALVFVRTRGTRQTYLERASSALIVMVTWPVCLLALVLFWWNKWE